MSLSHAAHSAKESFFVTPRHIIDDTIDLMQEFKHKLKGTSADVTSWPCAYGESYVQVKSCCQA